MSSAASGGKPAAQFGWWALVALFLVAGTVVYCDVVRLANPVGEKYVYVWPPGQIDFSYPYLGTRALLAGVNPYHNNLREFTHPYFGIGRIGGLAYKQIYPPGHLLLYVPLAMWKGADWAAAGRIWFHFNLLALVALGAFTWALVRRVVEASVTPVLIAVFCLCLAFSPGVQLGLERGQSDIAMALLCWGAVLCCLRNWYGTATFLGLLATSIKGYPILFTAGIGLLALRRRTWLHALTGAAVAVAITVVPVARLLADAAPAVLFRSEMFWSDWCNHSFLNAVYHLSRGWAPVGRVVLTGLALGVTLLAWIQARRAFSPSGGRTSRGLWLVVFAIASLGTMIGYSALSVSYNLILVLPGALVLATCQARISAGLALPAWGKHALGLALLGCLFLLFIDRLGTRVLKCGVDPGGDLPGAAFGLVALFLILAPVLGRALVRPIAG
jgi:hypothetical protein